MTRLAIAMAMGPLMGSGGCGILTTALAPANVSGEYHATITASSTCSATLPAAAGVLTYPATVTQTGTAVQVELVGHQGSRVTVTGTVSGQTVNFPSFWFSPNLTGGAVALAAAGKANIAADSSIAGILSGTYQTASGTGCNAPDHQLQLNKRVVTCSGRVCCCAGCHRQT